MAGQSSRQTRSEAKDETITAEGTGQLSRKKNKESQAKTGLTDVATPPKPVRAAASARSSCALSVFKDLKGAVPAPMPSVIRPMLATPIAKPFDDPEWLFEIKWDGYRAVAFIDDNIVRLVSRNQNDLTSQYSELRPLPRSVEAQRAVLDGEIVALDEKGRPSFSLMQQRTGFRPGGHRISGRAGVTVLYYVFDLIYIDGYDLHRVNLEQRKQALAQITTSGGLLRYSDHYPEKGKALFEVARQRGLEGIVAKHRNSCYEERRSREWLKIKVTQTLECVIGGYTEPEGSREHFGSLVLGLYDKQGRLIHAGQAGTGFDQKGIREMWARLKKLEINQNPFYGKVEALRKVHFVKPELVAEIKYSEWTHETQEGGPKLRAPVFLGLRQDKSPCECVFDQVAVT
jgi:bifunctional non-homologous end joining protein LigD